MTLINNEIQMVTITTNCLCQREDEETGEWVDSNTCFGDCHEWQEDDAYWLQDEWRKANGIEEDDPILIEVDRIGWTNSSAYKWTTAKEVYKSLYLDGDFTVEFSLTNGDTLTARRYSHDEPTGTGIFTFTHYKGCDKCGEPVKADIHSEEMGFCVDCSNAYFAGTIFGSEA